MLGRRRIFWRAGKFFASDGEWMLGYVVKWASRSLAESAAAREFAKSFGLPAKKPPAIHD